MMETQAYQQCKAIDDRVLKAVSVRMKWQTMGTSGQPG